MLRTRPHALKSFWTSSMWTQTYAGCGCSVLLFIIGGPILVWLISHFSTPPQEKTRVATAKNIAASTATPVPTLPTQATSITRPPLPRFATVAEAQREAVRLYPNLGVADSQLNKEFVARYKRYQQNRPEYFRDMSWPIRLAEEIALEANRPASLSQVTRATPSQTDFLAMQGIAKRIEEFMTVANRVTETKAMVPGKPASDGGYQIIILASKPMMTSFNDGVAVTRDPRKAWLVFAMGSAASYTRESPLPITSIAFADVETLKDYVYYVLDMNTARDIQQKMKNDSIDEEVAYRRITGALKKSVARPE